MDSASFSDRGHAARRFVRRAAPSAALLLAIAGGSAGARVLLTQEQALAEAFPGASTERRTAFLTDEQAKRFAELAGEPVPARVVTFYLARRDGGLDGIAWFDTHLVRTLPETVMVVTAPDARVRKVEVLSFEEPIEYLPRPKWFEQFEGRPLDKDLAPGRAIPAVTGATLTSRAVTAAARRCLALHQVICGDGGCPASAAAPEPKAPREPKAPPELKTPPAPPRPGSSPSPGPGRE